MEKAEKNLELITRYFTEFSEVQFQQLTALDALYKDWNSRINVISRKDQDSLYEKHILHSLSIAAVFDLKEGMEVLDLGTGGGFPGIPLAIYFPDVRFYLADSIGKKIKVVEAISEAVGLKNITARHTRAENIKNRKFDVVVSRAVAPLGDLWKWSKPLLREGGNVKRKTADGKHESGLNRDQEFMLPVPHGLICLKGGDLETEIAESGCRPKIMEIKEIFSEPTFKDKYILYVSAGK